MMFSHFYKNVRLLILMLCLIVAWGVSAYQSLPRMEDPVLSQRMALITTEFPGASAQRVESLVSVPIEQALLGIEEIKRISTTSTVGYSTLWLELNDRVKQVDQAWSRVRDKIADVASQLPETASVPQYHKLETRSYTLIAALTWDLELPVNDAILSRTAKDLEEQFRSLPGTETVTLFGLPQEEIQVEVRPADLATLGLTVPELSQQIQDSDAKSPAGLFRSDRSQLPIEVATELDSLERIRQIPICGAACGTAGQVVRLEAVAQVSKGARHPPSEAAVISGRSAVVLAVLMEPSQRIDQWTTTARQTLDAFQNNLPSGIRLQLIFDQSHYVQARLDNLFNDLWLGALLVVGSTTVLMGWRLGLIVGASLPLSVLLMLGGMSWLQIPLNQMSVTGLVIALGMGLDNSIVVADEVKHELTNGVKSHIAIAKAVRYLAIPLIASTLITVLSFLPIALLPGDVGDFVRDMARCVILALASFLVVCLVVTPALVGRVYRIGTKAPPHIQSSVPSFLIPRWWECGFSHPQLTRSYRRLLDKILAHPRSTIAICLLLCSVGFGLAFRLSQQFFPTADRDQFHIEFRLPASASLTETRTQVLHARDLILNYPEVADVHWFIGEDAPAFYYNLPRRGLTEANFAHGFVQLQSKQRRSIEGIRHLLQTLQQELDQAFPSSQILVRPLEQGPYVTAPLEVYLYGPNLEVLQQLGNQVRAELAQVPGVTHTNAGLSDVLPQLAIHPNEESVRLAGLGNLQIAQQLAASLEGDLGGSVVESSEEIPVRVGFSDSDRSHLNQIAAFELLPNAVNDRSNRSTIPLDAVGNITLIPEIAILHRDRGRRVNSVLGFVSAGTLPSTVKDRLKQRLDAIGFQLPPGYSLWFGGEYARRNEATGNLLSPVSVLLVLAAVILVLPFNSFRAAAIVALVGVCSVGFCLIALWLSGYPLGFTAILGIISMIGIEINDAMLVLTAIRADSRAYAGNRTAIREVVVRSTPHVIATTVTAVMGLVPLWLQGSEFWSPLALCIAAGVSGTTILALTFTPCAYLMLRRDTQARHVVAGRNISTVIGR